MGGAFNQLVSPDQAHFQKYVSDLVEARTVSLSNGCKPYVVATPVKPQQ